MRLQLFTFCAACGSKIPRGTTANFVSICFDPKINPDQRQQVAVCEGCWARVGGNPGLLFDPKTGWWLEDEPTVLAVRLQVSQEGPELTSAWIPVSDKN